jgi:FKBP-type peptidyl-prolyl cis-trans isomerase
LICNKYFVVVKDRMMRSLAIAAIALVGCVSTVNALQPSMGGSRRAFISQTVSTTAAVIAVSTFAADSAQAAPEILNTPRGVKYAVLRKAKDNAALPQKGDIVAIEYTGRCSSAN